MSHLIWIHTDWWVKFSIQYFTNKWNIIESQNRYNLCNQTLSHNIVLRNLHSLMENSIFMFKEVKTGYIMRFLIQWLLRRWTLAIDYYCILTVCFYLSNGYEDCFPCVNLLIRNVTFHLKIFKRMSCKLIDIFHLKQFSSICFAPFPHPLNQTESFWKLSPHPASKWVKCMYG